MSETHSCHSRIGSIRKFLSYHKSTIIKSVVQLAVQQGQLAIIKNRHSLCLPQHSHLPPGTAESILAYQQIAEFPNSLMDAAAC